jgi:hypothetical protein
LDIEFKPTNIEAIDRDIRSRGVSDWMTEIVISEIRATNDEEIVLCNVSGVIRWPALVRFTPSAIVTDGTKYNCCYFNSQAVGLDV